MSIVVTVAETSDIVVTTTSTIGDSNTMAFTPRGNISSTNIQSALEEIIDNTYNQASAPDATAHSVEEGDTWYDTTNDKLMVYRNTTWEEVIISAQLSESSDTAEYSDVTLNGGYF